MYLALPVPTCIFSSIFDFKFCMVFMLELKNLKNTPGAQIHNKVGSCHMSKTTFINSKTKPFSICLLIYNLMFGQVKFISVTAIGLLFLIFTLCITGYKFDSNTVVMFCSKI